MGLTRREFIITGAAAMAAGMTASAQPGDEMFGLIGKMTAAPGKRDELIAILIEGSSAMPGCLSYIVARDATDGDAIWVTEAWDSKASHEASLALPQVRQAIAKGRPLIAGFGERFTTTPVGGHGLVTGRR